MGVERHKEAKTYPEMEEKPGHSSKESKRRVREEGELNLEIVDMCVLQHCQMSCFREDSAIQGPSLRPAWRTSRISSYQRNLLLACFSRNFGVVVRAYNKAFQNGRLWPQRHSSEDCVTT